LATAAFVELADADAPVAELVADALLLEGVIPVLAELLVNVATDIVVLRDMAVPVPALAAVPVVEVMEDMVLFSEVPETVEDTELDEEAEEVESAVAVEPWMLNGPK
jgi:hypothetical protein